MAIYSRLGLGIHWNKTGKIWRQYGLVTRYMHSCQNRLKIPTDWEILEYSEDEHLIRVIPIVEAITPRMTLKILAK